ncbi:MAG TPA: hypothetical protein VJ750_10630 [Rhizomicrobium sp.]|nr:hypothetical protein [Rhizomicrobium sp.]
MTTIIDVLWLRLHAVLAAFSRKIVAVDPMLISDIGRTANDAFLLRGYLAFKRHATGDEVAITIDVQSDGQQVTIESDACADDGRVVATGPSAAIPLSESKANVEAALEDWRREFERFLLESEPAVVRATSLLT